MTEIKNPRIAELMSVHTAVQCMEMLNDNSLLSLNIRWAKERAEALQEQCDKFLELYTEDFIKAIEAEYE